MTVISKIKAVRRGGLAIVVLAAALSAPAQAAIAGENCSQTQTDPTAAQYCSVAGVHTSGQNGNKPANQGNKPASTGSEPTTTVTPVAVDGNAVQATTAEESGGTLPFTGLDVGILALVAVALAGTGFALRRFTGAGAVRS